MAKELKERTEIKKKLKKKHVNKPLHKLHNHKLRLLLQQLKIHQLFNLQQLKTHPHLHNLQAQAQVQ